MIACDCSIDVLKRNSLWAECIPPKNSSVEMRNMLLDSDKKVMIPVTQWRRTWLHCVPVLVFHGR